MATGLVDAFAGARARVQNLTAGAGGRAWDVLPSHDAADVPAFLGTVLPLLEGAQRQVIALTEAYVARELDRQPLGIRPENVIAGVRGDVTPEEVYRRPFVTLWWGLAQGRRWTEASAAARARLEAALKADVTLAMTHTMAAIVVGDPEVEGFARVPRGTCDLCLEAAGNVTVLQPIHPGCECVGEPVKTRAGAPSRPTGIVAVREHGELGPVLVDKTHEFAAPGGELVDREVRARLVELDTEIEALRVRLGEIEGFQSGRVVAPTQRKLTRLENERHELLRRRND